MFLISKISEDEDHEWPAVAVRKSFPTPHQQPSQFIRKVSIAASSSYIQSELMNFVPV